MLEVARTRLQALSALHGESLQEAAHQIVRSLRVAQVTHVRRALADPEFAFANAQAELLGLRNELKDVARRMAPGLSARDRRNLLDVAYLCREDPLTGPGDLERLRLASAV